MRPLVPFFLVITLAYGLGLTEDEFVAEINKNANGLWVAEKTGIKAEDIIPLLGAWKDDEIEHLPLMVHQDDGEEIPKEFDARSHWSKCKSISEISDQAECGSCWAMAATGAMSDRSCIHKDRQIEVSAFALMTCCEECGSGCDGGYPSAAWQYWKSTGIVSGGLYGDNSTCQPYGFPHCDHHVQGKYPKCEKDRNTPPCKKTCVNGKDYNKDKSYGASAYHVENDVKTIQREILKNGPVSVAFEVFSDFLQYKSGVYKHVSGQLLGGHAVRMIGWGEEKGTPYWLIANSWNEDWGDKGLFKIIRGRDECGIESSVVAGLPK